MYDGAKDAYSCEWSRQNPFFRGALCTITLSYKGIKNNASPVYRRDEVHGTCDEYPSELMLSQEIQRIAILYLNYRPSNRECD